MKRRYFRAFPLLWLLAGSPLFAQDFNDYKPLESSGRIPDDFIQLSSEKYEQDKSTIARHEKSFDKRAKRQFYLENSFRLRELLHSGKILFNDPVGVYVNQVADRVLAHDPALRKQIRNYVVKSPSVNAFATNSGMVFINLGLIAQLETESQLAFILSHEFTHYLKKHVVNQYVEDQKIDAGRNVYRSLSGDEKLLSRNNYSKELETEADLHGLEIFLKSDYSTRKLKGVFDVMQFDYLPFDDVPFEKSFLESQNLQLPPSYFLEKVKSISPPKDEDESKSTHPSIEKRRGYILDKISSQTETHKKDYLVSEEAFLKARKAARYDLSSIYLANLQYEKAFYNSYLLLREMPGNQYLQKIVAKSLYGLTKYANEDDFNKVHTDYQDIEGCSQQVYHLFEKLKPKELNAVALKYIWNLKKKYPGDQELNVLSDDLLKSLVNKHCESKLDFSTKAFSEIRQASLPADTASANKLNKYAKIDQSLANERLSWEDHFVKYIFVDNFGEKDFTESFDKYLSEKEKANQKRQETKRQKRVRIRMEKKEKAKAQRIHRKKGYALGIDKIVMVNPWYAKIDQRKKKPVNYMASESAELALNNQIMKNAERAKLEVDLLGDHSFTSTDVQKFNDYVFLKNWFRERAEHLEAEVPMENLEAEQVQALVARYGTKYYCWSGLVDVREKKRGAGLVLFYTAIVYPLLPFGVYYAVTPDYNTYYYSLVFDITTGKPVFTDIQYIDRKNNRDILNSTVYNTFYQLKKKR